MSLAKLQNTTIMSTELTHARLKHLAAKFGVTEDIVSRLALGIIREGKISDNWKPKEKKMNCCKKSKVVNHLEGKLCSKANCLFGWFCSLKLREN